LCIIIIIIITTGPKSAQCTLKLAAAVSRGTPRICHGEPQNLQNVPRATVGPSHHDSSYTHLPVIMTVHTSSACD